MAKKTKDLKYYEGVDHRKEATARVRLYIVGKDKSVTVNSLKVKAGEVTINNKPADKTYLDEAEKNVYLEALKLTQNENRFATVVLTKGGGKVGQLEAIVHGMARAVEKVDKDAYRQILKKRGLFVRDSRTRQRRMVGTGGKARRAKQSPKR